MFSIEIHDLQKHFDSIVALKGITLTIPRGHIVGCLGPNGAGKSTLFRLISGVMKPSGGTATIGGYDLLTQTNEVKKITGLLPEEYSLYEKLTVKEYIEFLATLYDLDEHSIDTRFEHLAKQLSIYDMQHRLIETLSKGQKQKVALIAALVHEPDILLLDEPLANLDVLAQRVVRGIIRQYQSQEKVILIATHLLNNVQDICDYVIILNEGQIQFSGPIDELETQAENLEEAYISMIQG